MNDKIVKIYTFREQEALFGERVLNAKVPLNPHTNVFKAVIAVKGKHQYQSTCCPSLFLCVNVCFLNYCMMVLMHLSSVSEISYLNGMHARICIFVRQGAKLLWLKQMSCS